MCPITLDHLHGMQKSKRVWATDGRVVGPVPSIQAGRLTGRSTQLLEDSLSPASGTFSCKRSSHMAGDLTGIVMPRKRTGKAEVFRSLLVCIVWVVVYAQVAEANIVGEAITSSVVAPVFAVLRERGGFNQSSGPTPFLRASTDEQLVPYVNSCHVLLPNGEPDCDAIAGMCASKEGNCAYVNMIENVAISGLVVALLLAIVAISSCTLVCFSSRDPPSDNGGEDYEGGTSVAKRSLVAAVMVGVVVLLSSLGFLCMAGVLSDVLVLLDGVQQVPPPLFLPPPPSCPGARGACRPSVASKVGRSEQGGRAHALSARGHVASPVHPSAPSQREPNAGVGFRAQGLGPPWDRVGAAII